MRGGNLKICILALYWEVVMSEILGYKMKLICPQDCVHITFYESMI